MQRIEVETTSGMVVVTLEGENGELRNNIVFNKQGELTYNNFNRRSRGGDHEDEE